VAQQQTPLDETFALFEEANGLYKEGTTDSLRQSVDLFEQSLQVSENIDDPSSQSEAQFAILSQLGLAHAALGEQSEALAVYERSRDVAIAANKFEWVAIAVDNIADAQVTLGDRDAAIASYRQALVIARDQGNRAGEAAMLSNIGTAYDKTSDRAAALDYFQQSLAVSREIGDFVNEATALDNIGSVYSQLGDRQQSIDYYQQALDLRKETGKDEGVSLNNLGTVYSELGSFTVALDYFQQALSLHQEQENKLAEASTLNNIGGVQSSLGESDLALGYYQQALAAYRSLGDRAGESITLNNIGSLYDALGDSSQAIGYLRQALQISRDIGDRIGEAGTLSNIGGVHSDKGDLDRALAQYQRALSISKTVGDLPVQVNILNNIGLAYQRQGEHQTALGYFLQALPISQNVGNRKLEAAILNNFGFAYSGLNQPDEALDYYQQSLVIAEEIGDRTSIANSRGNLAAVYASQDDLETALIEVTDAIALIEDLRNAVTPGDLRASYFSTVQGYYQFRTDLLMRLGQTDAAFDNSEASRARLLLELLSEANVDLRSDAPSSLITLQNNLEQQLRDTEAKRTREQDSAVAAALETESDRLLQELENTLSDIRAESPAYAELNQPQPLSLAQVHQTVLDADTALLQYSIGPERSYLWIVGQNQFQSYTLPGEQDLEPAIKTFLSAITNDGSAAVVNRMGLELTDLILPDLPDWIAEKRLLVAADGLLAQVPFHALPLPNQANYTPLLVDYEVLSQPSISTVAVLREQLGDRPTVEPSVAILADPVYSADDKRVEGRSEPPALSAIVQRSSRSLNVSNVSRLPYTQVESDSIVESAKGIKSTVAQGFDASYDWMTSSVPGEHSIVHLATHGFVNPTHPELSGLLLNLVNSDGSAAENGFLRLHDIFNLELSAELVVLSACQTGLGPNVNGEGIIGLSRGFMYAGAERVMVSLWNVNDESTAQLMGSFYEEMLGAGLTPAAALRAAQKAQWLAGERPNRWAAFMLQGEWQ